jgi:ferrous iron transport protein A
VRTGASSASGLLERLAQEVLQRGGYLSVEAGYCQQGFPSLEQGVERAIARGAQRIIAVPVSPALLRSSAGECLAGSWQDTLHSRIHAIRLHHAEIEIVYAAPPFDLQRLADLVVSKAREYEPISYQAGPCNLHELTTGETALVCSIAGGGHFRSRMASLGFTPGALVKMVQNYGHGAVIVSLRGTRVALGRGEARKVGISRGNHHGQPGL